MTRTGPHLDIIEKFIRAERGMRDRVLKGPRRTQAMAEADTALNSVTALRLLLTPDGDAQPTQASLLNETAGRKGGY